MIPDIRDLLQTLDDAIWYKFLPALTGRLAFSDDERDLLFPPARLGGMGIQNPVNAACNQYNASSQVSAPLDSLICQQTTDTDSHFNREQKNLRDTIRRNNHSVIL